VTRSEIIVGLDIGTTKVCTIVGEPAEEERIDILGVGMAPSTGLRKGVVVDIDSTVQSVEQSVRQAERAGGVHIGSVFVGVTGEHIASLNSRGVIAINDGDSEITESHVARATEAARVIVLPPDRQILHNIPRTFIVDGQDGVRHPIGMSAQRLEVETHVVTGRATLVENVVKCVRKAGLAVEAVVLEPLASGLAVVSEAEKAIGCVLVDIGGGTTDMAVYANGGLYHSAAIPVGGNHITYDLSVGLRVPPQRGEELKKEYGAALAEWVLEEEFLPVQRLGDTEPHELPRRLLAEIIEPRVTQLFSLVREEIARVGMEESVPAGLILTGGGAQLYGMAEVAQRILQMPVRIGRPRNIGIHAELVDHPMYATAVGLVQHGAGRLAQVEQAASNGSMVTALLERMSRWLLRLARGSK
jgi:cell division protein FtsA